MRVILGTTISFLLLQWLFIGWRFQFGPFQALGDIRLSLKEGNGGAYNFDLIEKLENSPLNGRNVLFLGSSVTRGHTALYSSIPEFFSARFGCRSVKDAVDGTTLADTGENSYVSRLKTHGAEEHYDLVVVQLSTNDATKSIPLGEISTNGQFDTQTVTGAIEFILTYAEETWGCPVVFYTNAKFDSEAYSFMVTRLHGLQAIHSFGIIDLWSNDSFNTISEEERTLYMYDAIHPLKAGYRDWWGPELEVQFLNYWNSIGQ